MTKILYLLLAALFLFSTQAAAEFQGPDLENWDDETSVLLARALVAEADWSARDHAAIAWTLYRQWKSRQKTKPSWTLQNQVKAYCSVMKGKAKTARHQWILELPANGSDKPTHWTEKQGKWENYQPAWNRVLRFTTSWAQGRIADPCKGQALHWGAPYGKDLQRATKFGWKSLNCGPVRNMFWKP